MASTQEKTEKDRFFHDLYLLDSLDDELPDSEVDLPNKPIKKPSRQPLTALVASQDERRKPVTHKSKSSEHGRELAPRSAQAADSGSTRLKAPLWVLTKEMALSGKRKITTAAEPESRTRLSETAARQGDTELRIERVRASLAVDLDAQHRKGEKPAETRRHVTDLSNIKQRKRQLGSKKLPPVPVDQQMFRGLLLYFVPNNDICPARRFRIHKAIQHGAVWANEWYDDVTHIVVCENLDVEEASKELGCIKFLSGPILVNVNWLIECFSRKVVCETHWNRFQVPGSKALKEAEHASAGRSHPTVEHGHSIDSVLPKSRGKRARSFEEFPFGPGTPDEETPWGLEENAAEIARLNAESESEDELEDAIRTVRNLGSLPLEPSFDEEESLSVEDADAEHELTSKAGKENAKFMCMERHDGNNEDNPNAQTIEKLLQMAEYYSATGDQWRTRAYRQAIAALRKQTQFIRTKQEALAVAGIGERIAEKIQEIVSTGNLQRLDNAQIDPRDKTLRLFMGIYHVGFPTASRWIAEGHRTLDDLYQNASLNRNQRIGIEHYDDFKQRIPREEVIQHAAIVKKELEAADRGLQMIIGGSYRRGSKDCGDIDILIFKKDAGMENIQTLMTGAVIPKLTARGFLKSALASSHHQDSGSQWHGASALPGAKVWRRIDLLFVPWESLGAALIYFTGNDYFNRSLRLHASRKQMRLNQHGLYADVMRGQGRERITDGKLLEGHDEKRIFKILGVTYRPPEHRNP